MVALLVLLPAAAWGYQADDTPGWFAMNRLNVLAVLALFSLLVMYYSRQIKGGREIYLRRIAGLDALEEAVGRATEMGRPVLYVPGVTDIDDIQTIYSMMILERVAEMVARYDTPLIVPVGRAFVVPLAQETIRQGYLNAGRPDAFRPENVRYLSDEQFAFTAGVNGIIVRERPAANIYMGAFYAESLILSETGFVSGAVQIAGTANIHQLPFFVVSCDYTLIGEEFFATTAYLTRDPDLLGAIKAADTFKVLVMGYLLVGCVLESLGIPWFSNLLVI